MRQKEPNVLRGLAGVEVVAEGLRDSSLAELDNSTVPEDVEAVLTAGKVPLLPHGGEGAILYVNIDLLAGRRGDDLVAGLELQLLENVRPERDPETRVLASTWDEGVVLGAGSGDVAYVRDSIRSLVACFIDAYRSANAPA